MTSGTAGIEHHVPPFQGTGHHVCRSQGVALGWQVAAPSGRNQKKRNFKTGASGWCRRQPAPAIDSPNIDNKLSMRDA